MSEVNQWKLRSADANQDAAHLARMADTCWRRHYTPIIGKDQVDYMLRAFQSPRSIAEQIDNGRQYFIIEDHARSTHGYIGCDEGNHHIFLSKFYVLPRSQSCGIGSWIIRELSSRFPNMDIHLTVNKDNNSAIAFYEKNGFAIHGPIVADIGNGFVMNDWKMVKNSPLVT